MTESTPLLITVEFVKAAYIMIAFTEVDQNEESAGMHAWMATNVNQSHSKACQAQSKNTIIITNKTLY